MKDVTGKDHAMKTTIELAREAGLLKGMKP
jgi:hypothetical protein